MSRKEFKRFLLSLVATVAAAVATALVARIAGPGAVPVPQPTGQSPSPVSKP